MSLAFPYVYYSCPCTDPTAPIDQFERHPRPTTEINRDHDSDEGTDEAESRPLDPRAPRTNYSLYPLEYLLYCVDCHEIRCPRCTREEVNLWFCPACGMEVAGSRVKGDQQRCSQNCFQCPVCAARLSINSMNSGSSGSVSNSVYYLNCHFCHWTSLELGVQFDKPVNIASHLARKRGLLSGASQPGQKIPHDRVAALSGSVSNAEQTPKAGAGSSGDGSFEAILSFYKTQLKQSVDMGGLHGALGEFSMNSPASLSRLISFYSATSSRKGRDSKPVPIREARTSAEGLRVFDGAEDDASIESIRRRGWFECASVEQRKAQTKAGSRFLEELWPIPPLLRTKRSKRCRRCRQILFKPEPKLSSTKCKIKLLALNNVVKLMMRPLSNVVGTATISTPSTPATPLQSAQVATQGSGKGSTASTILQPYSIVYFVLTVSNPLDEPVSVHLAAPSTLSGFEGSKITIMKPEFEVGANADAWDDVLDQPQIRPRSITQSGASVSSASGVPLRSVIPGEIWEKGRNWTSVVLELAVGCPNIPTDRQKLALCHPDRLLVEIPVFVRTEYEATADHEDSIGLDQSGIEERRPGSSRDKAFGSRLTDDLPKTQKMKLEQGFWTVIGAGQATLPL